MWLTQRGVSDLNTVRGSGSARRGAIQRNETFITEERVQLRQRLLIAAHAGKIPFCAAQ